MIATTLEQIATDCDGYFYDEVTSAVAEVVTSVCTDNRQVTGGELFVAFAGERADGNRFANDALLAGAVGVLTANPKAAIDAGADPARLVVVDGDPIEAVGKLARAALARVREQGDPNLAVVAVTGSVGKTTTKDLLASLLDSRGPIIAPPGSFNNELGLPLTVLRANEDTATLVLEMGADHVGNLDYLTSIAPPDVSVVLAVARAHLGEFGGIDNVAKAKAELVQGTKDSGVVVLNADDPRVAAMAEVSPARVRYFSSKDRTDLYASEIELTEEGKASFVLHAGDESAAVQLQLVGRHHVSNALAAASVAHELGSSLGDIATVLSETGPASPHRMDVFTINEAVIIDDSYNANPDSMRAGIDVLAQLGQGKRRIAVLGAMLELGDASDQEHGDIGEYVASAGTDVLVCVGDHLESASKAAFKGGVQVYDVDDVSGATELLSTLVVPGDVVLLKGSNGSGVWQVADDLKGMK